MSSFIKKLESAISNTSRVEQKKNGLHIKSKDRFDDFKSVVSFLDKEDYEYEIVMKPSKSKTLEVISLSNIDLIFKPIIQKGAGGIKFENELEADLKNYFNGSEHKDLRHSDVILEMESQLGIDRNSNYEVIPEGSKNQKRSLTFNGSKITIGNNTGKTLTDLTLKNPSGDIKYLSLKMSKSYYTLSASIGSYFKSEATQVKICKYFGFDGMMMGGFGDEYVCNTGKINYNTAKKNLIELLDDAVGHEVVILHKKMSNNVLVKEVGTKNTVSITKLDSSSYLYPEEGKRKYANIKVEAKINGSRYKVNFQFRGTTAADRGPKYLRILLERL